MKGIFSEFDPSRSIDYQAAWESAIFVFDTNVLLNLYRYQAKTRDELLEVLESLSDRIWIPHHVALEFQRNRLSVIADQNKRFAEVEAVIEKSRDNLQADLSKLQLERRHSLIDPNPVMDGFRRVAEDFLAKLKDIQKEQQELTARDPLKEKLEELFESRVGEPPSDQKKLDSLYKDAEARYSKRVPPGYMDAGKDKDGADGYSYGGLSYRRKYGDYVVWHQILCFANSEKNKSIIFVTDDAKEDWWWLVNSNGLKTVGPRPELIEEARRVSGVETFLMYKPENFLSYSQKLLKTTVSSETLEEVRDISRVRNESASEFQKLVLRARDGERAVFDWLSGRFEKIVYSDGFPDFIASKNGRNFGFEVKTLRSVSGAVKRIVDVSRQAQAKLERRDLDLLTLVFVLESADDVALLEGRLQLLNGKIIPRGFNVMAGVLGFDADQEETFHALIHYSFDEGSLRKGFFPNSSSEN